ncbi:hypothetical protein EGW08_010895 [Elysia chlorotica]|uniref:UPAR/Ly6 domain-containing protein qvr n=1 Tax=Elysia chlorotica TaxID=188477 RepID=A0A433TIB5_ELYCH|nr:hypothetical protein EGW08_010895 [Elysia chlorotica]
MATRAGSIMVPLVIVLVAVLATGFAQNDFSESIQCYKCKGEASNSSCADPVDTEKIGQKKCNRGICLKWTKYEGNILQIYRSCSSDLNFQLTMIDGVCRTERNGNGWLCMCGKRLCNGGPPRPRGVELLVSGLAGIVMLGLLVRG